MPSPAADDHTKPRTSVWSVDLDTDTRDVSDPTADDRVSQRHSDERRARARAGSLGPLPPNLRHFAQSAGRDPLHTAQIGRVSRAAAYRPVRATLSG